MRSAAIRHDAAGDLQTSFQHRSSILSKMSGGEKVGDRKSGEGQICGRHCRARRTPCELTALRWLFSASFSSRYVLRPLDRNAYIFRGLKRRFRDITQAVSWLEQAKDRMQTALMRLLQKIPPPPARISYCLSLRSDPEACSGRFRPISSRGSCNCLRCSTMDPCSRRSLFVFLQPRFCLIDAFADPPTEGVSANRNSTPWPVRGGPLYLVLSCNATRSTSRVW